MTEEEFRLAAKSKLKVVVYSPDAHTTVMSQKAFDLLSTTPPKVLSTSTAHDRKRKKAERQRRRKGR